MAPAQVLSGEFLSYFLSSGAPRNSRRTHTFNSSELSRDTVEVSRLFQILKIIVQGCGRRRSVASCVFLRKRNEKDKGGRRAYLSSLSLSFLGIDQTLLG
jgi:hypothetical protein